jgi:hypothetical protein
LGESLKHAERIQVAAKEVINSLPGAADREMQRAGKAEISAMSVEVGRMAQRLAGDAAAAEKAHAIALATKWTATGVIACAVVFGGTGYGLRVLTDAANISIARNNVASTNVKAAAAITAAEKKSSDEIDATRRNAGWAGTAEGRLAKKFFDSGAGHIAATCDSPVWEVRQGSDGKYCIPKRRNMIGGDTAFYGWKIP